MSRARILVVEDQTDMAVTMAGHLQQCGYEPIGPCASAEAALRLAERERPDLALMDVNLAFDDDGVAAAENLRERFNIRSVLITGLDIGAVLPRASRASPVGFLNKPFNGRQLQTTIEMALHLKAVQAQLHESRQSMAAMLQASAEGLLVIDRSGRIMEANEAACRLSGRASADLIGQDLFQLCPETRAALAHLVDESRGAPFPDTTNGAPPVTLALTCHTRDQSHLELTVSPPPPGVTDRFVCFLRDITEKRQNEELVRKLSRAVEQSPVSIVITDAEGVIEYVNPCFERVTGYSFAEAVGQNPRVLKSGAQSADFYRHLWSTIKGGHQWHGEFHNRRRNGEYYWESASISPVRDHAGRISHFIAVKEDITESKQAARELERINAELTAAIARTRELAEAANAASAAKSAFLASMSHELRTPLNVINGVSATMVREFAGTKPAESARLILECGEHLLGIISEILDISVLQGNRARLDIKGFDLLAVLSAAIRTIAVPIREKALGLTLRIAPGTPLHMEGDARRLQQILINLLQNAVKFTTLGGIHLGISATRRPDGQWRWSFSVSDSGIGISREQANRLFEPFVQATQDVSRNYGGTGLGLAISRSLARLMGGDLFVRSVPSRGSCFRCSVVGSAGATPRLTPPAAPHVQNRRMRLHAIDQLETCDLRRLLADADLPPGTPRPVAKPPASDRPLGERIPLRILAADDIRTNREVLRGMLSFLGYKADFAANGEEVINAVVQNRYDLLLLDVQMPVMDGLTAATELRRRFPDPADRPRIVALTANALGGDRDRCLTAGMDDYLAKPLLPDQLEACILHWFDRPANAGTESRGYPDRATASPGNPGTPLPGSVAPAPPAEPALLDLTHLDAAFGMFQGLARARVMAEMESLVVGDYESALPHLLAACHGHDGPELARRLHSLKGCFLSIGWARLSGYCALSLQSLRDGSFQDWAGLPGHLDALWRASRSALAQHIGSLSANPGAPNP